MFRMFAAVVACSLALACSDDEPKDPPAPTQTPQTGTETNVAPAPCQTDADCGKRKCMVLPEAEAGAPKFCQEVK